jgi:hypothetical protein
MSQIGPFLDVDNDSGGNRYPAIANSYYPTETLT